VICVDSEGLIKEQTDFFSSNIEHIIKRFKEGKRYKGGLHDKSQEEIDEKFVKVRRMLEMARMDEKIARLMKDLKAYESTIRAEA